MPIILFSVICLQTECSTYMTTNVNISNDLYLKYMLAVPVTPGTVLYCTVPVPPGTRRPGWLFLLWWIGSQDHCLSQAGECQQQEGWRGWCPGRSLGHPDRPPPPGWKERLPLQHSRRLLIYCCTYACIFTGQIL